GRWLVGTGRRRRRGETGCCPRSGGVQHHNSRKRAEFMRFGRAAGPKRSIGRSRAPRGWRNRILAIGAAVFALPVAAGIAAPTAVASPAAPVHRAGLEELMVPSSMGPIKVQVQWAARGGNAGLCLLDGLRAREDRNAWSFE